MGGRRARLALALGVLGLLGGWPAGAVAQELEPRAYGNAPVGLNFLILGYGYSRGGVAIDPAVPIENAEVTVHGTSLAYVRSLSLWGRSAKLDVVVPYGWLSGTADVMGQAREREVQGLADPRLRLSVNLYGAPALELPEFQAYRQDVIVGVSLQVGVPLGQYDRNRLVNIGTNRWLVKPEVGVSKALGSFTLELATGVAFYSDNDDFLGGRTREQHPIVSVQTHLLYSFDNGIWLSVDGTYYTGGRTVVDGVAGQDLQRNARIGLTVALPIDRHNSLKAFASTGVSTRTGADFDTIGIAWQYRWGGGL